MKKIISTFLVLALTLSLGLSSGIVYAESEPTINFDSIPETGLVNVTGLSDFKISVTSAEPESVELFIDGISLGTDESAPFSFNVPEDTLGAHTATAKAKIGSDVYIEAEKEFTIFKYVNGGINDLDYSYLTDELTNTNMLVRPDGNTEWNINGGTYDEDWYQVGTEEDGRSRPGQGRCLVIVPDTDVKSRPQDHIYTRMRMKDSKASTYIRFETDFYMSAYSDGTEPKGFRFGIEATVEGSRKTLTIAQASKDGLIINGTTYPMAKDTWHRIILEYDYATKVVSAWLGETQLVNKDVISGNGVGTSFYWVSLAPINPGGEYRLDNTKLYCIITSPHCNGISSGGEMIEDAVYTNPSVSFKFNRGVKLLDDTKVTLKNELGDVVVSSVNFDTASATLTITPEGGFEPSNSYSLILPSTTEFDATGAILQPLSVKFKTSAAPLDVLAGKIRTAGTKVFFETELGNTTGETKTLIAYISVYKNGVFQKLVKTSDVVLTTGNTLKVTTPDFVPESGAELKAFVTDNTGAPISNKIYTLGIE